MLCLMAFSLCVMTGCKDEDEPQNDKSDGLVTEGYADLGLTRASRLWSVSFATDAWFFALYTVMEELQLNPRTSLELLCPYQA